MQETSAKSRRSEFSACVHPSLTAHKVREVSVAATCDPRVVVRYLYGGSQHATVRLRVASALAACGHADLVGTEDERKAASTAILRQLASPKPSTAALRPFAGLARPQRA